MVANSNVQNNTIDLIENGEESDTTGNSVNERGQLHENINADDGDQNNSSNSIDVVGSILCQKQIVYMTTTIKI